MSLDAMRLLVPDRADRQFILCDAECPLSLGKLYISFPQDGRIGIGKVVVRNM
jgi:hypothetical protein